MRLMWQKLEASGFLAWCLMTHVALCWTTSAVPTACLQNPRRWATDTSKSSHRAYELCFSAAVPSHLIPYRYKSCARISPTASTGRTCPVDGNICLA